MSTVSIHEAKTHLSELIAELERVGGRVIISRYGRPVAELTPITRGLRTAPDPALSRIEILSDPTEPTLGEWDDA